MRRRLPVLASPAPSPNLPIAQPCHADWDAMDPQGSARKFCGSCQKSVHHLSAMPRRDAQAFLRAHAGQNVCVRYTQTRDGQILFSDETPPRRAASRLLAAAAPALAFALAACTPHGKQEDTIEQDEQVHQMMGAVAVVPDDPPEPVEVMGEAMIEDEPCAPEPEDVPTRMGKIAPPEIETETLKGDVAVPDDVPNLAPEPASAQPE